MRVLTIGTFDPLHSGHLGLFRQCRRLGGEKPHLTVGINSDQFIEKYKGIKPLLPHDVRADVIAALELVDEVAINTVDWRQSKFIDEAHPDILVVGQDWALKDYLDQLRITQAWLNDRNIQLAYVPRTGDWSSTDLKSGREVRS